MEDIPNWMYSSPLALETIGNHYDMKSSLLDIRRFTVSTCGMNTLNNALRDEHTPSRVARPISIPHTQKRQYWSVLMALV